MHTQLKIGQESIAPGESKRVDLFVSRLPSGTKINISTHVFRSEKPGPTVLVMGGVHGDEINGIQIVRSLIEDETFGRLSCGSVIAIPLLNVFGFINFSRDVPDGKDVNRSFPGSRTGSLASRTASVLTKKVLSSVDYAIDLHTGGAERFNHPQIRYSKTDEAALRLAKSFAAPYTIQRPWISKSFRKTANQMGIPVLVYEAGESVRINGTAIQCGVDGIKRALKSLKMLREAPKAIQRTTLITSNAWVRASDAGLFTWYKCSGEKIKQGDVLGIIQSPNADRSTKVIAKTAGHIIGHNNASVVNYGDALFNIAHQ